MPFWYSHAPLQHSFSSSFPSPLPGAEFLVASYICSSFILFLFLAHNFLGGFFLVFFGGGFSPSKLNLLILRIRCLKTESKMK